MATSIAATEISPQVSEPSPELDIAPLLKPPGAMYEAGPLGLSSLCRRASRLDPLHRGSGAASRFGKAFHVQASAWFDAGCGFRPSTGEHASAIHA
jgi:hypothetical protein